MALPLGLLQGSRKAGFLTSVPVSPEIARLITASRNRVNFLRGQGFVQGAEIVGGLPGFTGNVVVSTVSPRKIAAASAAAPQPAGVAASSLPPGGIPFEGVRRGTGGKFSPVLAGGGPVPRMAPAPTPVATQGVKPMGIRAQLISPSTFLSSGSTPLLGGLIQGGLDIVNTFISSKLGATGVASPSPTPLGTAQMGGLIPTGGPVGMAAISAAIVAAGGAIVGTVIRISRVAWAAIPSLIKQAAIAVGLTVAFTDVDLIGGGGGGQLSLAQQRKIARFQQLTGAGVPPGIAARATGIGRRRRKGISAFELSGFRKISHLLGHVGMVPRGLRGARPARGHHHHK